MQNGKVDLTLLVAAGRTYVLEVSSDLVIWTTIQTGAGSDSQFHIQDSELSQHAKRFYRLSARP